MLVLVEIFGKGLVCCNEISLIVVVVVVCFGYEWLWVVDDYMVDFFILVEDEVVVSVVIIGVWNNMYLWV